MFIRVTEVLDKDNISRNWTFRNVTLNLDHISSYKPDLESEFTRLDLVVGNNLEVIYIKESIEDLDELIDNEGLLCDGTDEEDDFWESEDEDLNVVAGLFSTDFSLYLSKNVETGTYLVEVKNDEDIGNLKEVHSGNSSDLINLMEKYCKKLVSDIDTYIKKESKPKPSNIRLLKTPKSKKDDETNL